MDDPAACEVNSKKPAHFHALETHSSIKWNYASTFLVTWRDPSKKDECVLGSISDKCSTHVKCFIAFGCDAALTEVALTIHLSFKLGVKSSGYCNTYLVIPVDAVNMRGASTASYYDFLVPPATPQFNSAGVQEGKEFVHCHFSLKTLGRVAMQVPTTSKRPSEHARRLLLSLKSLSQAMSFDVYLPRTPGSEDAVRNFFLGLRSDIAQAPQINYQSTFSGREVVFDDWKKYQIYEDTLVAPWNPLVEQNPPTYEETVQHRDAKNPSEPPQPSPNSIRDTEPDTEPNTKPNTEPNTEPDTEPDTETPYRLEDGEEGGSQVVVQVDEGPPRDKATQVERKKDLEASGAPQKECHREDGTPQSRPLKRKAGEVSSHTEPIGFAHTSLYNPSRQLWVGKYYREVELARRFDLSWNQVASKSTVTQILSDVFVAPSSVLSATGPNRKFFNDNQFNWFGEAVLWLRAAWTSRHDILDACFCELNIMCLAIGLEDEEMFLNIREECTTKFIKGKRGVDNEGPWEVKLADRAQWICQFLRQNLGNATDTLVFDEILPLQYLSRRWKRVGGDSGVPIPGHEQEYAHREMAFNTQMAACVLVALYKKNTSATPRLGCQNDS